MIIIKNKSAIQKMVVAGEKLASIFEEVSEIIVPGTTTANLDSWIQEQLKLKGLVSSMKGYAGYKHVSCISINDEVVHGVPSEKVVLKKGDFVKVDVCASWKNYCADMARCFFVEKSSSKEAENLAKVVQSSLDKGIEQARVGNHLSDIGAAIQKEVEKHGYGVVRDFAGHGIGKRMHEDPEVLNYGKPGKGPVLRAGMALAIEPMITLKSYEVYVDAHDGWTARTSDGSLAAHIEDTVLITDQGPCILTRP